MDQEARLVTVAALDDLVDGQATAILLEGHALLLTRQGDVVRACQQNCPHEKANLAQGWVRQGRLVCPRHLASFDLDDGSVSAGWRLDRLRLYPVRVEDGAVAVDAAAVGRDPPSGLRRIWDFLH